MFEYTSALHIDVDLERDRTFEISYSCSRTGRYGNHIGKEVEVTHVDFSKNRINIMVKEDKEVFLNCSPRVVSSKPSFIVENACRSENLETFSTRQLISIIEAMRQQLSQSLEYAKQELDLCDGAEDEMDLLSNLLPDSKVPCGEFSVLIFVKSPFYISGDDIYDELNEQLNKNPKLSENVEFVSINDISFLG